MTPITKKVWETLRREYVEGEGSLSTLAVRHGLNKSTVEKRAKAEGWTKLRRDRDDATRAALVPAVPAPTPLPIYEPLSAEFFQEARQTYLADGLAVAAKIEAKLLTMIPSCSNVVELAAAARVWGEIREGRRVLLGVPLVAPIRQTERPARRAPAIPVS